MWFIIEIIYMINCLNLKCKFLFIIMTEECIFFFPKLLNFLNSIFPINLIRSQLVSDSISHKCHSIFVINHNISTLFFHIFVISFSLLKKEKQLKIRCYSNRHSFLDKMSCHFCSFTCYWISIENMKQNDCGYLAEQCSKKQTNNFSQTTLESFEKVLGKTKIELEFWDY